MPRLFWKIFLALWLSIMLFSALMAWINLSLTGSAGPVPGPDALLVHRDLKRAEQRLQDLLRRDNHEAVRNLVRRLPPQARDKLLIVESGHELLGRDRQLRRVKSHDAVYTSRSVNSDSGRAYQVIMVQRLPPRLWMEPGLRGLSVRLLLAALVSALVSAVLARYLSRPLEQLGQASRRLASGDLSTRVGPPLQGRADEFGALARDLDEMAARLQELQSANQQLLRDVSHELRSPLARLRVALEIARNRDAGTVRSELDRIELESERLETLVDEVLDLLRESSQASPMNLECFDLGELLTDLGSVVNYEVPEHSPGIGVDVTDPLPVEGDRELLWRAIENLLRNALLHTDASRGVELRAWRDGFGVTFITVADRGPGVPAAQLERIFEPFYRVQEARDRQSGGHGLGLAIAAAAVRRHRGSITARNREGGGLEFVVALPPADWRSGTPGGEGQHVAE